jgi:hypothetical protein
VGIVSTIQWIKVFCFFFSKKKRLFFHVLPSAERRLTSHNQQGCTAQNKIIPRAKIVAPRQLRATSLDNVVDPPWERDLTGKLLNIGDGIPA